MDWPGIWKLCWAAKASPFALAFSRILLKDILGVDGVWFVVDRLVFLR